MTAVSPWVGMGRDVSEVFRVSNRLAGPLLSIALVLPQLSPGPARGADPPILERPPEAYRLEGRGEWVVVQACGEDLDCRPVARVRESTLRFFMDKLGEDDRRRGSQLGWVTALYAAVAVAWGSIVLIRMLPDFNLAGFFGTLKFLLVGIPLMSCLVGALTVPVYAAVVIAILHSHGVGGGESLRRQIRLGVVGVGETDKEVGSFLRVFTDFVNRHGQAIPRGGPSFSR